MRNLFLTLVFGAFALVLTACGSTSDEDTLVVGLECAYAPYNWTTTEATDTSVKIDGTNAYCDGYDVKVAQLLADELGRDLVIKAIDWDGLIPALTTNQIDAIIAGMSPTDERKETIAFTTSYFRSEQVLVVSDSGTYTTAASIQDFTGASISAQTGTLQEGLIPQMTGAVQATSLADYPTLVTALKSGTIDGFIAELPVATQILNNNDSLSIVQFAAGNGFVVDEAEVTTSIGLRQGDTELLEALNEALEKITVDQRNQWMNEFINQSSS